MHRASAERAAAGVHGLGYAFKISVMERPECMPPALEVSRRRPDIDACVTARASRGRTMNLQGAGLTIGNGRVRPRLLVDVRNVLRQHCWCQRVMSKQTNKLSHSV